MVERQHHFGYLVFDRDAIVHAALRAYIEVILAKLDPLRRHTQTICDYTEWTGDLRQGAFVNANMEGDYDVIAWTETGVVGLAYELGFGPIEQLDLAVEAVTGGPDDVRGAVPGLPAELEPAFVTAASMLTSGAGHINGDTYVVYGEKLAGIGFWLNGDDIAGTLFDDPRGPGAQRLAACGLIQGNRLPRARHARVEAIPLEPQAAPIHAIIDAVTARALVGPTELTPDELATLCPTPPDPKKLLHAQRSLQKVGITWPGSPAIAE